MDIQDIRRRRLQILIDREYGGVQANFIEKTGINQGELSGLLGGKRTFGERKARGIERQTELDAFWLDQNEEVDEGKIPRKHPHLQIYPVPIRGSAKLGETENHFVDLDYPAGTGDGAILFATKDQDAYALRCVGDSMAPRIKHGEYVVIEPNRPPQPGDEVVVRDKLERVMVKVWRHTRDGMAYFESINADFKPFGIPQTDIQIMHYVAGIAKSALKLEE